METTDLRTEFTKETKTRFNTEWLAYNDYVDWLEQRLVKLLTIPPVVGRSEQLKCEHKGRRTATELVEYCEDCKKILFHP